MDLINDLANALATFEGYFKGGTLAARNNNPGNLRTWGSRPIVDGYAYFDTAEEGWAALRRQIALDISRGHTLTSFITKYAPPSDNNPTESYISFVASRARIPMDVPLAQLQGGRTNWDGPGRSSSFTWPSWASPSWAAWGETGEGRWGQDEWLIAAALGVGAVGLAIAIFS